MCIKFVVTAQPKQVLLYVLMLKSKCTNFLVFSRGRIKEISVGNLVTKSKRYKFLYHFAFHWIKVIWRLSMLHNQLVVLTSYTWRSIPLWQVTSSLSNVTNICFSLITAKFLHKNFKYYKSPQQSHVRSNQSINCPQSSYIFTHSNILTAGTWQYQLAKPMRLLHLVACLFKFTFLSRGNVKLVHGHNKKTSYSNKIC